MINVINPCLKLGYEISWSLDLCDKFKLDPMIYFSMELKFSACDVWSLGMLHMDVHF